MSIINVLKPNRKVYVGKVVSDKMDKTIVVAIDNYRTDAKYHKRIKYTTKLVAHDESNEAKQGDKVSIVATRPLSLTKHFRLLEIIKGSKAI